MTTTQLTTITESVQDPPELIRVGDTVMVTKPEFVIRVGYPLSLSDAIEWVAKNKYQELQALFNFGAGGRYDSKYRNRALRAAARAYLQCRGYGGNIRSIHIKRIDEKLGAVHTVYQTKIVKTGIYYAPSGHGEDWEPGGLDKMHTHVLLNLGGWITTNLSGTLDDIWTYNMWIERCNVRRIDP